MRGHHQRYSSLPQTAPSDDDDDNDNDDENEKAVNGRGKVIESFGRNPELRPNLQIHRRGTISRHR